MARRVKCPIQRCGRLVKPDEMERHLKANHGAGEGAEPPDVCMLCLAVDPHRECGRNEAVTCPVRGCHKACGTAAAVRLHVFHEHADIVARVRETYQATVASALERAQLYSVPRSAPPGAISCRQCSVSFKTPGSLRKHTRIYHNANRATLGCPTCLEPCRAPTRKQLMRTMAEKGCAANRMCPVCQVEIRPANMLGKGRRGGLSLLVQHREEAHGDRRAERTTDCLDLSRPGY